MAHPLLAMSDAFVHEIYSHKLICKQLYTENLQKTLKCYWKECYQRQSSNKKTFGK